MHTFECIILYESPKPTTRLMAKPSSKRATPSSPEGAKARSKKQDHSGETRRRLPNGMGAPIMVRPQPKHRELIEEQSEAMGVSMGLLAERLLAAGIRVYRKNGVAALDLPEAK